MENLVAALILYLHGFMVTNVPPGTDQHSLQVMPECGIDREQPTCELAPVCKPEKTRLCSPPFWSEHENAWVRFEGKEAGTERYSMMSELVVTQAHQALFCEGCEPLQWGQGASDEYRLRSLVAISAGVMIPESRLRQDVQTGRGRSRPRHAGLVEWGEGRGPGNEAGFWQPHPVSTWVFMEYKERPKHDYLSVLVGHGVEPIERSAQLFFRMIAHTRRHCSGVKVQKGSSTEQQRIVWAYRAISMYGTGRSCDSWNAGKTMARYMLFERFLAGAPRLNQ